MDIHASIMHAGRDKVHLLLKQQELYGITKQAISDILDECLVCKRVNPVSIPRPLQAIVIDRPWLRQQLDLVDFRSSTSTCSSTSACEDIYPWMLTLVDCYTKFVFAAPLRTKCAGTRITWSFHWSHGKHAFHTDAVAESLRAIWATWGAPDELQSDCVKEFRGAVDVLLDFLDVKHVRSSPYHPSCNGQIERLNGTLTRMIQKALLDHPGEPWHARLQQIQNAYNATPHSSTGWWFFDVDLILSDCLAGIPPFEIVFGRKLSPRQLKVLLLEVQPIPDAVHNKDCNFDDLCTETRLEVPMSLEALQQQRDATGRQVLAQLNAAAGRVIAKTRKKVKKRKFQENDLVLWLCQKGNWGKFKKSKVEPYWNGPFKIAAYEVLFFLYGSVVMHFL